MKRILLVLSLFILLVTICGCVKDKDNQNEEKQLDEPTINEVVQESEKEIMAYWSSVDKAEKYVISLNGRETVVADNYFNICNIIKQSTTVEIKVKARAEGYSDSEWSISYFYDVEYNQDDNDNNNNNNSDDNNNNNNNNNQENETKINYNNSLLGHGYNALSNTMLNTSSIAKQKQIIVDYSAINPNIYSNYKNNSSYSYVTSYSRYLENVSKEIGVGLDASLKILMVSLKTSNQFNYTNKEKYEQKKNSYYALFEINVSKFIYTMDLDEDNVSKLWVMDGDSYKYLSSDFVYSLYNDEPEKFFSKYGTHIITGYGAGGSAYASFLCNDQNISNSSESGFSNQLDIKVGVPIAEVGTSFKYAQNKVNENETASSSNVSRMDVIGGDGLYTSFDQLISGSADSNINKWMASIGEESAFISGQSKSEILLDQDLNMLAIWELLINDSERKSELKSYYDKKIKELREESDNKYGFVFEIGESEGEFGGGSGTEKDPYLIENEHQLVLINDYLGKENVWFKLVNDITITGDRWQPIGKKVASSKQHDKNFSDLKTEDAIKNSFRGCLDGNNKTIKYELNMDMFITENGKDYSFGLFALLNNAKIINLNVYGEVYGTVITRGDANVVGLISGWAINTEFTNCTTSGKITQDCCGGQNYAWVNSGGFVGTAIECIFSKCTNNADVFTKTMYVSSAGLVASGWNCRVFECVNTGQINAEKSGGFLGAGRSRINDLIYEE